MNWQYYLSPKAPKAVTEKHAATAIKKAHQKEKAFTAAAIQKLGNESEKNTKNK